MSLTPILDLEQDPPTPHLWNLRRIAGSTVIWIFLLIPIILSSAIPGAPAFNFYWWFPAVYLALAIHELGHLAAGKLSGLEPGVLCVGGFTIYKQDGRWIFRFEPGYLFRGLAGPLAGATVSRSASAWMGAGGPLATVCLTTLCALVWRSHGNGQSDWLGTLFWGSAVPLCSFIPIHVPGSETDAGLLWELFRHPERSRRVNAVRGIASDDAQGVLPRDWNAEWLERVLEAEASEPIFAAAHLYAYCWKVDLGDEEGAILHLEKALSATCWANMASRRAIFGEAAFSSARRRGSVANARLWLHRAHKLNKDRRAEPAQATQGAIAMVERRYEDAIVHWRTATQFIEKKKWNSGFARFCKLKYADYEVECREALRERASASFVEDAGADPSLIAAAGDLPGKEFPGMSVTILAIVGIAILLIVFR